MLTISRFLDLFLQKAWVWVIVIYLFLNLSVSPVRSAESSSATIKGTDASGTTVMLLVDRDPALYTGDFGDCMGGQSLINLTSFDAAYYADNMTVLFNMAGSTNLRNESLMIYISVQAYGEDRFNLVFNPCNANFESLCPLNNSVPIRGQALIPVSRSDVAGIPSIALNIPDFEGSAILRIFSNSSQTQIGCFSAVMRNGSTLSHPGFIGTFLTIFTLVGIVSSFATSVWVADKPENLAHYAHSLPVLLIFEVFQSIFFSGALSLNWPSILAAWWSNFALFSGMIYTPRIIKSLNSFVGISGNSSQVGGAGSTILNNNGGLQQQIYGRSLPMTTRDLIPDAGDIVKYLSKRATANNDDPRLYDWAGLPVAPGLPLPGNWSGFAGELSIVGIPAADAFLNGFIWLLILTIIITLTLTIFKFVLEGLSHTKWINNGRLIHFRTRWLEYISQIILRTGFIFFFTIMTLSLYQFSYGGKAGQVAIAVIVFLIAFGGCLAACFYVSFYQIQNNYCEMKPDNISLQPKKYKNTQNPQNMTDNNIVDDIKEFSSSLPIPHANIKTLVEKENQSQEIHSYIKIRKRYGWLLARYRSTRWWYFIVWVIYQFVRACLIGGARGHPMAQVIGLFTWEIIALVTLIIINPWEGTRNTVLAVWLLGISKVVTSGLSIAFLPQLDLPRISTTIIGIIIIITQGLLVLSLLILIILGTISSYMSLTLDQEQFKPEKLKAIRLKYFAKIENKPKTNTRLATGQSSEKTKEPYFSVKSFRREPKIDDEGSTAMWSIYNSTASHTSLPCHDSINRPFSQVGSVTESLQNQGQNYVNKVHETQPADKTHDMNHSNDLNHPDTSESSRAGTPLGMTSGSIINYKKIPAIPLIRPSTPVSCLKPAMPSVEQQMHFASQRIKNFKLVATLGSKSSTKKVTRKAILGVNLKKACETIIEPEAPMALRLQSSLLYGVTRVYTQKWDYLLSDTQAIYTSIRTFLSANKSNQIDKNAGKARSNQLVLADDPAFLVDDPLEPPSFEFNEIFHGSSPFNSSQSLLSIRPRSNSNVSKQSNTYLGLDIPSSSHGDITGLRNPYDLPNYNLFGHSSANHQAGRVEKIFNDDEQMLLQNDDLFEIDDYGEIRELSTAEKELKPSETMFLKIHPDLESTPIVSSRVRKEQHNLILGHDLSIPNSNRDGEIRWYDADADADPSNKNDGPIPASSVTVQQVQNDDSLCNEESSFLSAEAHQLRKKVRAKKNVTITDVSTELETSDMRKMTVEYRANMTTQLKLKVRAKENMASKKKAFHYIFGVGINGVGEIEGLHRLKNPLASFSGHNLQAKILGRSATSSPIYERKRTRSEFDIGNVITKRTPNLESELGRNLIGNKDDIIGYDEFKDAQSNLYDNSIEIGREAASALKDHPSSGMMPWNLSASAHSRPGSSLQRHGSRVTPASPLIGRGLSIIPTDLNRLLEDQEDIVMYDAHDNDNKIKSGRDTTEDGGDSITGVLPSSVTKTETLNHQYSSQPWQNIQSRERNKDFDIYGPAADVDTQTASTSQWVREALDRESCNFFYFLQGKIIDEINNFMVNNGDLGTIDNIPENKLTFARLIEPKKNSSIVAAQAFYHVLSLVNKNIIRVEQPQTEPLVQQRWQDESKIDNDIYISLVYN